MGAPQVQIPRLLLQLHGDLLAHLPPRFRLGLHGQRDNPLLAHRQMIRQALGPRLTLLAPLAEPLAFTGDSWGASF